MPPQPICRVEPSSNHRAGSGDAGQRVVGPETDGEVAMGVHGRGHAEDDIGRDVAAFDLRRKLREVARQEVDPALLAAGAAGAAEEQRDAAHMAGGLRIEIGVLAHRQNLQHLDIEEAEALRRQRRQQRRGFADTGGHDDGVAARAAKLILWPSRAVNSSRAPSSA